MSVVPIAITRRPGTTGRVVARRTAAPTSLVLLDDVEAAASANLGRCNDDNPYR